MSFKIGSSEVSNNQHVGENANSNSMNLGDSAIMKPTNTVVHRVFDAAGQLIESGSDVLSAPAHWLKDIQSNWFGYMIILAIIVGSITFFYCIVRYNLRRKANASLTNNMVQLATILTGTKELTNKSAPSITAN